MRTAEYVKGYERALDEFEMFLDHAIRFHGGVTTYEEAWKVLNDIIYLTHQKERRLRELEREDDIIEDFTGGIA